MHEMKERTGQAGAFLIMERKWIFRNPAQPMPP